VGTEAVAGLLKLPEPRWASDGGLKSSFTGDLLVETRVVVVVIERSVRRVSEVGVEAAVAAAAALALDEPLVVGFRSGGELVPLVE
jgi:hypothetical protein